MELENTFNKQLVPRGIVQKIQSKIHPGPIKIVWLSKALQIVC